MRLGESLQPITTETQHVFRKIEKRIARKIGAPLEDALGQEPRTRAQFENARSRRKCRDELGEANAHGKSPRLLHVAGRDPGVSLLGVEEIDTGRNIGVWIGVVNRHGATEFLSRTPLLPSIHQRDGR